MDSRAPCVHVSTSIQSEKKTEIIVSIFSIVFQLSWELVLSALWSYHTRELQDLSFQCVCVRLPFLHVVSVASCCEAVCGRMPRAAPALFPLPGIHDRTGKFSFPIFLLSQEGCYGCCAQKLLPQFHVFGHPHERLTHVTFKHHCLGAL